ncbi:MAG: anti-sigma factor domain-containing protein [Bacteroidia bacterium]
MLNALEPEEMAEVEEMAHHHPEVQAAINDMRETLAAFGQLHAETPPAALKNKVLKAVETEIVHASSQEVFIQNLPSKAEISVRYARVAIAASISLFLLSMLTALNFYLRWQDAARLANDLLAEKTQMAAERDLLQASAKNGQDLLAMITNSAVRLVSLTGTDQHPEASALVAWNPETTEVLLWVNQLPPPADHQQYQLWAIVDGQPVDAGVFDLQEGSLAMKSLEKAQAFAITLEPKGGSVTPNLEQLHAIGAL